MCWAPEACDAYARRSSSGCELAQLCTFTLSGQRDSHHAPAPDLQVLQKQGVLPYTAVEEGELVVTRMAQVPDDVDTSRVTFFQVRRLQSCTSAQRVLAVVQPEAGLSLQLQCSRLLISCSIAFCNVWPRLCCLGSHATCSPLLLKELRSSFSLPKHLTACL